MTKSQKKGSILIKFRNYFIAGVVVLIPIGITIYLTLFIVKVSSKILPRELNPNHYLPYNIPGVEIFISIVLITLIGWLSLSFIGKRLLKIFEDILKRIPIAGTTTCEVRGEMKREGRDRGVIEENRCLDLDVSISMCATGHVTVLISISIIK